MPEKKAKKQPLDAVHRITLALLVSGRTMVVDKKYSVVEADRRGPLIELCANGPRWQLPGYCLEQLPTPEEVVYTWVRATDGSSLGYAPSNPIERAPEEIHHLPVVAYVGSWVAPEDLDKTQAALIQAMQIWCRRKSGFFQNVDSRLAKEAGEHSSAVKPVSDPDSEAQGKANRPPEQSKQPRPKPSSREAKGRVAQKEDWLRRPLAGRADGEKVEAENTSAGPEGEPE